MNLRIQNLRKSFGSKLVLDDVSFEARSGSALGLLGRNGAGKTTTIRIIMQVFDADSGSILLNDRPIDRRDVRLGYLPEEKGLYPKYRIIDQMIYLGELRGMTRADARRSTRYWLDRLDLGEWADKKLEVLSKGNQQKIQLAVALIADPQVIILDEPFNGLDPVNAKLLEDIVREKVQEGRLVLFSSHIMNYVEQFCDRVALLHHGRIIMEGGIREIRRSYPRNRIFVAHAGMDGEAAASAVRTALTRDGLLSSEIDALTVRDDGVIVVLQDAAARPRLLQTLLAKGLDLEQFRVIEPSLEDIFVEKVGEPDEPEPVSHRTEL